MVCLNKTSANTGPGSYKVNVDAATNIVQDGRCGRVSTSSDAGKNVLRRKGNHNVGRAASKGGLCVTTVSAVALVNMRIEFDTGQLGYMWCVVIRFS